MIERVRRNFETSVKGVVTGSLTVEYTTETSEFDEHIDAESMRVRTKQLMLEVLADAAEMTKSNTLGV